MNSPASAKAHRALDVQRLRVTLAGYPINIVDEVSFSLSPGSVLGLVGESGSGKTTLALALLSYARPGTSICGGSVVIDGVDLLSLSRRKLREFRGRLISYVPQDPATSLNPAVRVGTQLAEVLAEHNFEHSRSARRARLVQLLDEVSLPSNPGFLSRYPHQLSGGQQQRVSIAMAFACRPTVVVLDEPTTGLDVSTQAHVLTTVRNLAQIHHTAAVYVSHDLAVVAGIATRIAVMYAGQIIELGPTDEVVRSSAHPYTQRLIEAVPDPKRRRMLTAIPGRAAPLGPPLPGCRFADRCQFAEPACRVGSIVEAQVSRGHTVRCRRSAHVRALRAPMADRYAPAAAAINPSDRNVLKVDELLAWYGANEVLHGVSFSIQRGSCLALVGESGSGKTTLARCISGMHEHAKGDVHLNDEVLPLGPRLRSPEQLRSIQYIFQNPYSSLNPRKTVRELLEQPLKHFGCDTGRDRVSEHLEHVSLSSTYARRYPSQLSGGERQRVAIARALAVSPDLLICDEITSSLDVSVQASILALLSRLHAERSLTVLFVTHNLAVVRAIADTIVVLNQGVIVEEGPADQLLDHPNHPYTRELLNDTPGLV